jgi:hypothetical protein
MHNNCRHIYQNNLLVFEDATFRISLLDKIKQFIPAMLFTPLCTYAPTKQQCTSTTGCKSGVWLTVHRNSAWIRKTN